MPERFDNERVQSIYTKLNSLTPDKNREYPYNQLGIAYLWIDLYGEDYKYCANNKKWYVWRKGCWRKEAFDNKIADSVMEMLNLLRLYCRDHKDEVEEQYKKFINKMSTDGNIKGTINILKQTSEVWVESKDFDNDPYILNTTNAGYDLRTLKTVNDLKSKYITKQTECANFVKKLDIPCYRWAKFIDEIMCGDKEMSAFLQRALGYSLLGDNTEECMFIAYGASTRNGKGTLFSTIQNVLGHDYCDNVSVQMITEVKQGVSRDYNEASPQLAKLPGVRIVLMSEGDKAARLDAAAMKTLTGRDEISARPLYGDPFSYTPQFTMWMNTNYLPAVNDTTVFASNRIWVIEFNQHFDEHMQDKNLKQLFAMPENRPTILKWLMDGCEEYLKHGLQIPQKVREATRKYEVEQDKVSRFIEECLTVSDSQDGDERGAVYAAYVAWCHKSENRYHPMGSTTFYSEMGIRGHGIKRTSSGRMMCGIRVKGV